MTSPLVSEEKSNLNERDSSSVFMTSVFTADDERRVRDVLRHYWIDDNQLRIDHPSHARGFSGALVVRVQTAETDLCLRRWPSRELSRPRLLELHRFLKDVHAEGVDVLPVPLAARDGSTLLSQGDERWQLEPWMPGVADFNQAPAYERMDAVMRLLARFHCVAASYVSSDQGRIWFAAHPAQPSPAVRERMAAIDRWPDSRIHQSFAFVRNESHERFREAAIFVLSHFRETRARLRAELLSVSQSAVRLHPCLRDVWHDHVLFTGDEVTGLIDPAATRTETVACDLSRLLGSLLGGDGDARWGRALETYERIRPLSPAEHDLIRVLHTSGTCLSAMTWVEWWMTGGLRVDLLPRVVVRLEALRRTMSCL